MKHGGRDSDASYSLGIDLGGTSVKAVCVTAQGKLLRQENLPFDSSAEMDWAQTVRSLVARVADEQNAAPEFIGFSAPGLASEDGRSIARMPGRFKGLEGLDWTGFLQAARPVPVLNDAHAALLGEAWIGAARGLRNTFLLTLGTGVGGAAMVDGHLLKGRLGRAGHLGHISLDIDGPRDICRLPGSLELMIGNCTVEERSSGRFTSTHELVAAHLAGDAEASAIWLRSIHALGCAISSLINVLDPEAVIIGGGIARSGAALFEPLEAVVRDTEWRVDAAPVKIVPAQLGELAGACGAAWNAMKVSGTD